MSAEITDELEELIASAEPEAAAWLPNPPRPCHRCGAYGCIAGIFKSTVEYDNVPPDALFCGFCIQTYISGVGFTRNDIRQVIANLALEKFEREGEEGVAEAKRLIEENT